MSSNQSSAFRIPDRTEPLPPRPNLEFERKRAKRMLRAIRSGDASSLARVQQLFGEIGAHEIKLAAVQLVIAREYGFASWPKLVAYYETWARHERAPHYSSYQRDMFDFRVKGIIASHARRQSHASQVLATFVPRFYGRTDAEIFDATVTEDDARLAVARSELCSSWDTLIEVAERERALHDSISSEPDLRRRRERMEGGDFASAQAAIDESDVHKLSALIRANPELVHVKRPRHRAGSSLLHHALDVERKNRNARSEAVTDLLVANGGDLTTTASGMLMTGISVLASDIQFLLDRGADPNWMTPAGMPILEWAILRYWNREAVDVIARRAKARSAFWIAAGLGDVPAMLGYLDRNGRPTAAARGDRPDFVLVGFGMPCRPDVDDTEIIWEAFAVAGFNERLDAIDALLQRGFPIDYERWGSTLLKWAEGNRKTVLAEHLLKRGS